jgi:hypothetical protein
MIDEYLRLRDKTERLGYETKRLEELTGQLTQRFPDLRKEIEDTATSAERLKGLFEIDIYGDLIKGAESEIAKRNQEIIRLKYQLEQLGPEPKKWTYVGVGAGFTEKRETGEWLAWYKQAGPLLRQRADTEAAITKHEKERNYYKEEYLKLQEQEVKLRGDGLSKAQQEAQFENRRFRDSKYYLKETYDLLDEIEKRQGAALALTIDPATGEHDIAKAYSASREYVQGLIEKLVEVRNLTRNNIDLTEQDKQARVTSINVTIDALNGLLKLRDLEEEKNRQVWSNLVKDAGDYALKLEEIKKQRDQKLDDALRLVPTDPIYERMAAGIERWYREQIEALDPLKGQLADLAMAAGDYGAAVEVTREKYAKMRREAAEVNRAEADRAVLLAGINALEREALEKLDPLRDKRLEMVRAAGDYRQAQELINEQYGEQVRLIDSVERSERERAALLAAAAKDHYKQTIQLAAEAKKAQTEAAEAMAIDALLPGLSLAVKTYRDLKEVLGDINPEYKRLSDLAQETRREFESAGTGDAAFWARHEQRLRQIADLHEAVKRGLLEEWAAQWKVNEIRREEYQDLIRNSTLLKVLGKLYPWVALMMQDWFEAMDQGKKKSEEQLTAIEKQIAALEQLGNTLQLLSGIFASFGYSQFGEFFQALQGIQKAGELWKEGSELKAKGAGAAGQWAQFNAVLQIIGTVTSFAANLWKMIKPNYTLRSIKSFGKEMGIALGKGFTDAYEQSVKAWRESGAGRLEARVIARMENIPQLIEEAGGQLTQAQWSLLERDLHWGYEELRKLGYNQEQAVSKMMESILALADQISQKNVKMTYEFASIISLVVRTGQLTEELFDKLKDNLDPGYLRAWLNELAVGIRQGTVSLGEFGREWAILWRYAYEKGIEIDWEIEKILTAAKARGWALAEITAVLNEQLDIAKEHAKELKRAWLDARRELRQARRELKEMRLERIDMRRGLDDLRAQHWLMREPGGAIFEAKKALREAILEAEEKLAKGGKEAEGVTRFYYRKPTAWELEERRPGRYDGSTGKTYEPKYRAVATEYQTIEGMAGYEAMIKDIIDKASKGYMSFQERREFVQERVPPEYKMLVWELLLAFNQDALLQEQIKHQKQQIHRLDVMIQRDRNRVEREQRQKEKAHQEYLDAKSVVDKIQLGIDNIYTLWDSIIIPKYDEALGYLASIDSKIPFPQEQEGGYIPGEGLYHLHPGEYVLPADVVRGVRSGGGSKQTTVVPITLNIEGRRETVAEVEIEGIVKKITTKQINRMLGGGIPGSRVNANR